VRVSGVTTLTVLVLCAMIGTATAGSASLVKVSGEFVADGDSQATAKFKILTGELADRKHERLHVRARGLEADTEYDVLLGATLDDAVSFGVLSVRRGGRATLRWRSKKDGYPDGVETLTAFGGESIYIVADDTVVLTADIPEFPDLESDVSEGAAAVGFGWGALACPDDSNCRATANISVAAANTHGGLHEGIMVLAMRLERNCKYEVVAIDADDSETPLGTMKARSRLGFGYLSIGGRNDSELPEKLANLAGQRVQIRDQDGNVVLEGICPSL
jgi:hypothetical protein